MRGSDQGWRALLKRVFKERQILIRSETGVSYIHFRKRHQYALAGVLAVGTVWAMATTVAYGLASMLIDEQSGQIRDLEVGYAELITDLASRYGNVQQAAEEIGETRRRGEHFLDRNAQLRSEIQALQTSLGASETAREVIEHARRSLIGRIGTLEEALSEAEGERGELEGEIGLLNDELDSLNRTRDTLLGDQDGLRREIARLTETIHEANDWNATLEGQIEELTLAVQSAYSTVDRIVSERDELLAHIGQLEQELNGAHRRNDQFATLLHDVQREVLTAQAERDGLSDEAILVRGEMATLSTELETLQTSQEVLFSQLRDVSERHVETVEQGLAFTGLDVEALIVAIQQEGMGSSAEVVAAGGPMIPSLPESLLADQVWADAIDMVAAVGRAADLRDVVNRLPIGLPLRDPHRLSSGFGQRRDPFTGRRSQHWGLDFAAPTRTPIYATAPGEVVTAGRRGAYGNMVEIDHGLGVTTRYAHLHSITVSEGDRVAFGDRVGLMGSTGRSTGSHLHYEIRVNGDPRNPINFLTAGQHVFEISN